MKVSEAKTKVCPFMSIGFAADTPTLRSGGLVEVTCRCGDCMAWQYSVTHSSIEIKKAFETPPDNKVMFFEYGVEGNKLRTYGIEINEDDKEGYCKRLTND